MTLAEYTELFDDGTRACVRFFSTCQSAIRAWAIELDTILTEAGIILPTFNLWASIYYRANHPSITSYRTYRFRWTENFTLDEYSWDEWVIDMWNPLTFWDK